MNCITSDTKARGLRNRLVREINDALIPSDIPHTTNKARKFELTVRGMVKSMAKTVVAYSDNFKVVKRNKDKRAIIYHLTSFKVDHDLMSADVYIADARLMFKSDNIPCLSLFVLTGHAIERLFQRGKFFNTDQVRHELGETMVKLTEQVNYSAYKRARKKYTVFGIRTPNGIMVMQEFNENMSRHTAVDLFSRRSAANPPIAVTWISKSMLQNDDDKTTFGLSQTGDILPAPARDTDLDFKFSNLA